METNTKYGIEESMLHHIISILSKNPRIDRVLLFGSRAKGNFRIGSDIDLALTGKELELDDILDASLEIDNLNLPYKFDLVIYDRIKEPALLEHIDRVGVALFSRI